MTQSFGKTHQHARIQAQNPVLLVKWLVNLLLEKYLKLEFSSRVLGDVVVDPLKPKKAVEVAEK